MQQDFIQKVLETVAKIPYGRVTSYGAIARHCGAASSSRMVGYVLSHSAENSELPYHRVVNRNGLLTGKFHFLTPFLMKELLLSEGIQFDGDKVRMKEHFWQPED
jgi:methylated-DNA-protein-cysteine methyltransferase-like protein